METTNVEKYASATGERNIDINQRESPFKIIYFVCLGIRMLGFEDLLYLQSILSLSPKHKQWYLADSITILLLLRPFDLTLRGSNCQMP